ncbi:MAG: hypothetical protein ABWZ78_14055, partial [Burkholderiaceae bacterium]
MKTGRAVVSSYRTNRRLAAEGSGTPDGSTAIDILDGSTTIGAPDSAPAIATPGGATTIGLS